MKGKSFYKRQNKEADRFCVRPLRYRFY